MVAIGVELGLDVIAEGVETLADRDALAALGCTKLQGYFFGRPMALAQFDEWYRGRQASRGAGKKGKRLIKLNK